MKQPKYIILLLAMIMVGGLFSCSEVEEVSEYDNWHERNDAYVDSLHALAGSNLFSTGTDTIKVDQMNLGALFGLQTATSTTEALQYVYCKKLSSNPKGKHPLYNDYVTVYYCGSYLNGYVFDGNFDGYVATDTGTLYADEKLPSVSNTTMTGMTNTFVSGWITALQYMRVGERWMIYVPYGSGYGSSDKQVLGYSTLVFDIILTGASEHL